MSQALIVEAEPREDFGKKQRDERRRSGRIPAWSMEAAVRSSRSTLTRWESARFSIRSPAIIPSLPWRFVARHPPGP